MLMAITRGVSASLAHGERTHIERMPIELDRARAQHAGYVEALRAIGLAVRVLPPLDELGDSCFVEDVAIALPELVIITRPGAASRRPETAHMAEALDAQRPLQFISAPGTVDGGDVLVIGRRLLVGIGARTNQQGADQLKSVVEPFGYTVEGFRIDDALHLKSACTALDEDTILANPDWIDTTTLGVNRVIGVAGSEPFGANALSVAGSVIVSDAYPQTREILEEAGYNTTAVNVTELHKAEAGVTCMSVILR